MTFTEAEALTERIFLSGWRSDDEILAGRDMPAAGSLRESSAAADDEILAGRDISAAGSLRESLAAADDDFGRA
jgi:hypothetical protein